MPYSSSSFLYKEESFILRGAIFDVYNHVGCGFLEGVYQECLSKEFKLRGIPFIAQAELQIVYKGEVLEQTYRPDFICYGKIIVELKALQELGNEHRAQLLNYLRASNLRLGLLVNFGTTSRVTIERIVL